MPTYSFKACAIFKVVGELEAESLEEARAVIDSLSDKLRQPVVQAALSREGPLWCQSLKLDGAPCLITSDLWVEEGDHELA